MTNQLPERPNLEQLKRQAKDLLHAAQADESGARARFRALPALTHVTEPELAAFRFALHDAQSVIARECGFVSWNALRERVEELTLEFDTALKEFLCSAVDERPGRAWRLLALHPGIARANFHAALVLGDFATVENHLARDRTLATRRGGPRHWEPLLYVCMTRLHRENSAGRQGAESGLVAIARRLLELGADPNASFPWQDDPSTPLPALWGATCEARIPTLAKLLLEAGAKPNDGESIYHAAEHGDLEMLDLLLAHGADVDGGRDNRWGNTPLYFILGQVANSGPSSAVRTGARWLLEHGADPNRPCTEKAETSLHAAAKIWDSSMLELLVRHGADIHRRRRDGRMPYASAALRGNSAAADWLHAQGAVDELTATERFLAACTRGDRATADAMLAARPELRVVLAKDAYAQHFLHHVAERGDPATLETMLACGFDVRAVDESGATALHWTAWGGHLEATRLLLAHGAPVDVRDKIYQALPLGWADHGSVHGRRPQSDYVGVSLALLRAGSAIYPDVSFYADDALTALTEFKRSGGEPPLQAPPA